MNSTILMFFVNSLCLYLLVNVARMYYTFWLFNLTGVYMLVERIKKPTYAYLFAPTADGNNFEALAAEVIADGGTAEQLSDITVKVSVHGVEAIIPLNYALVIASDHQALMSAASFHDTFAEVGSVVSEAVRIGAASAGAGVKKAKKS